MKVTFNEVGNLIVTAEDNTERVALKGWWDAYNDSRGETGGFHVDSRSYLMANETVSKD